MKIANRALFPSVCIAALFAATGAARDAGESRPDAIREEAIDIQAMVDATPEGGTVVVGKGVWVARPFRLKGP